jgi:hypothetical protein
MSVRIADIPHRLSIYLVAEVVKLGFRVSVAAKIIYAFREMQYSFYIYIKAQIN